MAQRRKAYAPGRTTRAGYGTAHQRERDTWRPIVDAGMAFCAEPICLMPSRWIPPGSTWDLAHDRTNPGTYRGAAHARCNRSEGASHGNRQRARVEVVTSLRW